MRKGLLLDRDGVINREIGRHVHRWEDFEILPDVPEFLRRASEWGFRIVIVSNQSGIAKGLYGHGTVRELHRHLVQELEKYGASISGCFYAPHHPSQGNSLFRKPDSLMLERALAKFDIDPDRALFIGDKESDREAGERAGIRTLRIEPNSSLLPYLKELERIS